MVLAFISNSLAFGRSANSCHESDKIQVSSILIIGNYKTQTYVVERELGLNKHDKYCRDEIDAKILAVERLSLFADVEFDILRALDEKSFTLNVKVTEKWTTIPVLKFNSGGGVSQYTVGVYDPNIFGKYIESGFQYENLGGANSGVVWFKNPRLFNEVQGIDLQYWNTKRIRIKYDQEKNRPIILKGFLQEREKVYADYFREMYPGTTARASLEYNDDNFSTDLLPDSVLEAMSPLVELPPPTKFLISKVGLEFGQIDGKPQMLSGKLIGLYFGYAHSVNNQSKAFTLADFSLQFFKVLDPRWQFAQRVTAGVTATKVLQYWYYLGGLDRIRGFADNRFAGSQFFLSNTEIRTLIFETPSILLQAVGFLDFAAVGDRAEDLRNLKAASVGTGVRLILPKFYRFVVRIDYAQPILNNDTNNLSLGVQQFF